MVSYNLILSTETNRAKVIFFNIGDLAFAVVKTWPAGRSISGNPCGFKRTLRKDRAKVKDHTTLSQVFA